MENKLHIISSGSKANALLIETPRGMLLIDQGLSFKRFKERCTVLGIDYTKIAAILVTHEHTDHIKGVPLTAKKLNVPVFSSSGTAEAIRKCSKYEIDFQPLEKDRLHTWQQFSFVPFPIMHDAVDPVGYSILLDRDEMVTVATDTGLVTNHMLKYLSRTDFLIVEANHDKGMLHTNPKYPWPLKQRIKSNVGHLSNDQCLNALDRLPRNRLRKVVMSHLSEENNNPSLLRQLTDDFIMKNSFQFQPFIATQDDPFSVLMV